MAPPRCWFVRCRGPVLLKERRPVPAALRARNDAAFLGSEVVHDNCRRAYDKGGVHRDRLFVPRQQKCKAKPVSAPVDNRTAAFLVEHCMGCCQQMRGLTCVTCAVLCPSRIQPQRQRPLRRLPLRFRAV